MLRFANRLNRLLVARVCRWHSSVRGLCLAVLVLVLTPAMMSAQVVARNRPGATPSWNKGMVAIDAESYYHAIECGKQGGADPACVFWDTGFCKNGDFELAFYSGYKQVAYEVWNAVRQKKPAPQPGYQAAQRTRVVISVTPVRGSKNALTDFVVKRGGKVVPTSSRSVSGGGGQFTYDYAGWAPTRSVSIDMIGKTKTVSCAVPVDVLRQMR